MDNPTAFGFASGPLAVRSNALAATRSSPSHRVGCPQLRKATLVMQEAGSSSSTPDDLGNQPILKEATKRVLKDFITRRAVKTILFYFLEFHDAPSRNWLLQFDNFETRDKAKSFKDSDAYITKMLSAPVETCKVVMAHPRGYFKREFSFDIVPSKIAQRILASRDQLAEEFAGDLKLIKAENQEINRQHLEKMVTAPDQLARTKALIFDSDPFSGNKSPLRAKNYRDIKLLITDLAVGRALVRYREEAGHHYLWLGEHKHSNPITDGDKFVSGLLDAAPVVKSNPDTIVSPMTIATDIMRYRETIAEEWICTLSDVPEESLGYKRGALEKAFATKTDEASSTGEHAGP